eukprot:CAMPEP_0178442324 /NCGR_PEP_ID=MMETSP0689_2-20121128/38081_1 /TAXON_ID=160604 /ORGANISM="Amphidinium massartii, Strain CS-259" /LENGTH=235 /DNA_ID=CAMNT_0020065817 /DNA_START=154 /DNA_END=858 /DNA_ORIENTATION=-
MQRLSSSAARCSLFAVLVFGSAHFGCADRGELVVPVEVKSTGRISQGLQSLHGNLEDVEQAAKQASLPITSYIDVRTVAVFIMALVAFGRLCWSMLLELQEKTNMLSKVEEARAERQAAAVAMSPRTFARQEGLDQQARSVRQSALQQQAAPVGSHPISHPQGASQALPSAPADKDALKLPVVRETDPLSQRGRRLHNGRLKDVGRTRSLPRSPKQVPPTAAHRPSRSVGPVLSR